MQRLRRFGPRLPGSCEFRLNLPLRPPPSPPRRRHRLVARVAPASPVTAPTAAATTAAGSGAEHSRTPTAAAAAEVGASLSFRRPHRRRGHPRPPRQPPSPLLMPPSPPLPPPRRQGALLRRTDGRPHLLGDGQAPRGRGRGGSRERQVDERPARRCRTDLGISEQRLSIDKDSEQRDIVRINPPNEVTTHTRPRPPSRSTPNPLIDPPPFHCELHPFALICHPQPPRASRCAFKRGLAGLEGQPRPRTARQTARRDHLRNRQRRAVEGAREASAAARCCIWVNTS